MKLSRRQALPMTVAALSALSLAHHAHANDATSYPSRPITIANVPYVSLAPCS